MQRFLRSLAALLVTITATTTHASDVREQIEFELKVIRNVFEVGYAPAQWKRDLYGWDLEQEFSKALNLVANKSEITPLDYRMILKGLTNSTRDYHVGIYFHSTESARLPFSVIGAGDRLFITYVDPNKGDLGLKVGDEILTWNGQPVLEEIASVLTYLDQSVPSTDRKYAEILLTKRFAAMGMPVPQGKLEITVQRGAQTIQRQLNWEYTAEDVPWNPAATRVQKFSSQKTAPWRDPQMTLGTWSFLEKVQTEVNDTGRIGARKSYVPDLGTVIWRTDEKERFDAYIYLNAGKLIGYVRIPSYMGGTEHFDDFKKIIAKFQSTTDALVIDQINNPGGSLWYLAALTSVLSNKPVKVPGQHVALWPEMMNDIAQMQKEMSVVKSDEDARKVFGGDRLSGIPVNYQLVQGFLDYARFTRTAWQGKAMVTEPVALYGFDKINPDAQVNYTKPVLVLINELDFSGGDFFPAILQDNKIAKTFGARTAGAGGYVLGVTMPSALGLAQFSFTGSLARRVDNQPIENLGMTPDYPYTLTAKDLTEGFVDYKNAINGAVQDLLK